MTEQFAVEPDHLESASRTLWKLSEDNNKAISYAAEWLDIQSSGGLVLSPVLDQLQAACDQLKTNYTNLGIVTDQSATELLEAGRMYRTTDYERAKNMDWYYGELDK
ncbi:MAG TPA: type VII secretion target [Nocardia sp.]|uniref:type VII secretion target n=1 Tax=Nocardia TaxID=1817 RepID=UPI0024584B69|nr:MULTISPECIES: type VII secretion target [Nocardia]HLS78899.1 type VII secretion target [Nocardia sp.]